MLAVLGIATIGLIVGANLIPDYANSDTPM